MASVSEDDGGAGGVTGIISANGTLFAPCPSTTFTVRVSKISSFTADVAVITQVPTPLTFGIPSDVISATELSEVV